MASSQSPKLKHGDRAREGGSVKRPPGELTGCTFVLEGCEFGEGVVDTPSHALLLCAGPIGFSVSPGRLVRSHVVSLTVLIGLHLHSDGFGSSCVSRVPCILCVLLGRAVTEGEVRRCPCWACTSQSRVGGENSSLRACRQAGKQRPGSGLGEERARQARRVMVQEPRYLVTFLTCPWEVLSICIGSAGVPRLASCKCLLSPSECYQAARRYVPRSAGAVQHGCTSAEAPNYASCVPLYGISRRLEVPRSRPEVPNMFSPSIYSVCSPSGRCGPWAKSLEYRAYFLTTR